MAVSARTHDPAGISLLSPPDVPSRTMESETGSFLGIPVLRSMFTSASSSFMTISILSVPMPDEITVSSWCSKVPVTVLNSLFSFLTLTESKNDASISTLPGSPTIIILSEISPGSRFR